MQLVQKQRAEYTVFLSSGDDALHLRDLVDELVRDAVNAELDSAGLPVRLLVRRWERTAPGRADGETVNARFVRMAKDSSIALCLLLKRLGPGTKEEIEAVLETEDVELAILWFVSRATWPQSQVGKFLKQHKHRVYVDRVGSPERPAAAVALVRVLLSIVFQHFAQSDDGGFRERR